MNIVTDYDELSQRSDEIDTKKENALLREIVLALKNKIAEDNLPGLAAPQLGYKKRVLVVNFKGKLVSYVNPVITGTKGLTVSNEQCPSFPGKKFIRPRNNEVAVMFQDPMGKTKSQKLVGLAAYVFQELVDHLDGLLLPDVGFEVDDDFYAAPEDERWEVIEAYLKSLDINLNHVERQIDNDKDAKQMDDAVKFMESVRSGETKIEIETVKR